MMFININIYIKTTAIYNFLADTSLVSITIDYRLFLTIILYSMDFSIIKLYSVLRSYLLFNCNLLMTMVKTSRYT